MARLKGRGVAEVLADFASDAGAGAARLLGPLLHRHGADRREEIVSRALLLALIGSLALLVLDLRQSESALPAAVPLGLGVLFVAAGLRGGRAWRGRPAGLAHVLLGGVGGLAALTLARAWAGASPGRAWILAWYLSAPVIVEVTLLTIRSDAARPLAPLRRVLLYGAPVLAYALLPFARDRLPVAIPDQLAAAGLLAAALLAGAARALVALRERRAIDSRQRGKLLAAGEGFALVALLAAVAGQVSGRFHGAWPLMGLAAAPAALCAAAIETNLLWVDRLLRVSLAALVALPPVTFLAWLSVRWGGFGGIAIATLLVVSAPPAWRRLGGLVERVTLRSRAGRRSALGSLEGSLSESSSFEEVALAVRAAYERAYPGVRASLMLADSARGGLVEPLAEKEGGPRRSLAPDNLLAVRMRTSSAPLTRYEVLSEPAFSQNRGSWLHDLDDMRAAALLPCRDGKTLRGVVILGGQVRGGFFTEDEMRDAWAAAAPIGPMLSQTLALAQARVRIARLELALNSARDEAGRFREEESRAMDDLEQSTRHVMEAYTQLKIRGMEAKEVRMRLASSAGIILAGRVLSASADEIAAALEAAARQEDQQPARRQSRGRERPRRLERARQGLDAIAAVTRMDPVSPCSLSEVVQSAIAALEPGWRGVVSLDCKIEDVPDVVWPRGALQAALLALLVNAWESIEGRGTITVSGRARQGSVLTIADAEASMEEEGVAIGQTPGKRAWMSGAPRVEITISDTGIGIPQSHQERLFTPFFTTKPARPGSLGLGLSIVADALAHHGGSIRVESEPGAGSSFVLELPGILPGGRPRGGKSAS